jgi:murein hydrolase activator
MRFRLLSSLIILIFAQLSLLYAEDPVLPSQKPTAGEQNSANKNPIEDIQKGRDISEVERNNQIKVKLDKIQKRVKNFSKKLEVLEEKEKTILEEIRDSQSLIEILNEKKKETLSRLEQLHAKSDELERDITRLKEEINNVEQNTRKRLRALYLNRADDIIEKFLLSNQLSTGAVNNAFLLKKVREYDLSLVNRLAVLRKEHSEQEKVLGSSLKEQERIKRIIEGQESEILKKNDFKKEGLTVLAKEREKVHKVLANLKIESAKLEEVLSSITGGGVDDSSGDKTLSTRNITEGGGIPSSPIIPIRGKILQRFGKEKVPEFEDFILHKGIEFSVPDNQQIVSIAKGIVRFVGQLPGYGTMVIVDHGVREYSLYGRLSNYFVEVGKEVESGQAIATSSIKDKRGRNFYFEIRKSGSPVNPQRYFGDSLDGE